MPPCHGPCYVPVVTPVGHAAFSYMVAAGLRRVLAISVVGVVVGGVLPDIDFAVVWAPGFNAWHRVVTHNLLVCAVAAVVAAGLGGWRWGRAGALALGAGVGLGALGHLVVDSMMDTNPSNGIGVAWLWPWSERASSPYNLMELLPVQPNPAGWGDLQRMATNVLAGVVWELPFWVGAGVLWWRGRLPKTPIDDRSTGAFRSVRASSPAARARRAR